jgi:actin-related protein
MQYEEFLFVAGLVKAGIAGEEKPRVIFPSIVGRPGIGELSNVDNGRSVQSCNARNGN